MITLAILAGTLVCLGYWSHDIGRWIQDQLQWWRQWKRQGR